MKKRKLVAVLMAVAFILSACAGGTATPASQSGTGSSTPAAQSGTGSSEPAAQSASTEDVAANLAGTEEEVHLRWITIGATPPDLALVLEEANKLTKEKINATVEMVFHDWGDYDQKATLAINAGEQFDIMFTCSWAADYFRNARGGAFLPLNDPADNYLEKYGKEMVELINPSFLTGAEIDGLLYGVPTNKELPYQAVWNVNVALAEKYDIDYKTAFTDYASLEPYLEKVKEGEGGTFRPINFGGNWIAGNQGNFEGIQGASSLFAVQYEVGNPQESDYTVRFIPEMDTYKETLDIARKYYEKDLLYKEKVLADDAVNPEKSGEWLVGAYHYMPYNEINDSVAKGYQVDYAPIHEPIVATWSATGSLNAISVASENPERAMMFLNMLNSDAALRQMIGYGIEGTHYTVEDGRMVRTAEQNTAYGPANFALGNVFLTMLTPEEPADKWEKFDEFNDSGYPSPVLGFSFVTDPVANELASLENVFAEFERQLTFGAVDPDVELPNFIAKCKAAGSDKVLTEIQRQLDEWRATQ